ncbi:uncharacterized protein LTR77_007954 [Saxophila tyrrhenica]|uniref:Uncharacterized protein n=1 Tax=Saxophila tyrrhenica TaxID=1690608 RepID=A0AAV9P3E0_9PEZI|nr:hypothetical protein LTR77_007954 [Saxophila tyrrhenica]
MIGNVAKLSGQGGWDPEGDVESYDWKQQIDHAFDNVDRVLQAARLRGWEDVYLLRSYQTDIGNHFEYLVETLKKRVPSHRPLWTALGISKLAEPAMTVKLEVEAIKQDK